MDEWECERCGEMYDEGCRWCWECWDCCTCPDD